MKHSILGSTYDFRVWPHFNPGTMLDFNPSVFQGANGAWHALIRRDATPPDPGRGSIWWVPVDADLKPIGEPSLLIERGEDPRAVVIDGLLYLFYAVIDRGAQDDIIGSTVIMSIHQAVPPFALQVAYPMPKNPSGRMKDAHVHWEKNWVPFVTPERLIGLIYTHDPWEVLILDVATPGAAPSFVTNYMGQSLKWAYGDIRGGTTPVPYDKDHLITFFHSSQVAGSRSIYMVGACTFKNHPPYEPVTMTDDPLFHGAYHQIAARHGWGILASVLFPLGAKVGVEQIQLISGIDDGQVGVVEFSRTTLDQRLHPLGDQTAIGQDLSELAEPARRIVRFFRLMQPLDGYFLDLSDESPEIARTLIDQFGGVIERFRLPSHRFPVLWKLLKTLSEPVIAPVGELGSLLDQTVELVKVKAEPDELGRKVMTNLLITGRPMVLVEQCQSVDAAWSGTLLREKGYQNSNMFSLHPEYQLFFLPSHVEKWPHLLR